MSVICHLSNQLDCGLGIEASVPVAIYLYRWGHTAQEATGSFFQREIAVVGRAAGVEFEIYFEGGEDVVRT